MTFFHKSYGEWSKVEKPVLSPMSYEGSDDNEEVKSISANNENNCNYFNVVSNYESDDDAKENICEEQVDDKITLTPKPHFIQKSFRSEKFAANKFVELAAQKESARENKVFD